MQLPGTIHDLDEPQLSFGEMSHPPSPIWQIEAFLSGMESLNSSVDQLFYQPCGGPRSVATTAGREDEAFDEQAFEPLYVYCCMPSINNDHEEALSRNVEHSVHEPPSATEIINMVNCSSQQQQYGTRSRRNCRRVPRVIEYEEDESAEEEEEFSVKSKSISGNETKNIPKNFGKAIISFVLRNRSLVEQLLEGTATFQEFLTELRPEKRRVNTIADLRSLWLDHRFGRELRVLSNLFLRKHALTYIFSSRVTNQGSHIKYRGRLREALRDPRNFTNIKDY